MELDKKYRNYLMPLLQPNNTISLLKAVLNFSIFFFTILVGIVAYQDYFWYVPLLWIPLILVIFKSFLFLHDTGHYNMFSARIMNEIVGRTSGLITTFPYGLWQYVHNYHHKTFANLDERDFNPEIWIMTVEEYRNASEGKKLFYRFVRSKFARFALIPLINFLLTRIPSKRGSIQSNTSILMSDAAYIIIGYFILHYDLGMEVLWTLGAPWFIAYSVVAMVFYMQHQYEEVKWYRKEKWSLLEASIHGASFMDFGPFLNSISENVRYHHVHHYNCAIPSVNLPKVHQDIFESHHIKPVHFKTFYKCLNLKLWDEKKNKMVPIPKQ
ncbi:fatty acid desaturase family protein [Lishizhenia sp.]|uniref:fatty acid desaturase family protein n=1 Tax=Lishizhenia sp. TaxID=2497594 RepID=UPI00299D7382|nr:fatty acid desaturase [Lishizhenia sp.]MDX1446370.1 fatty acid desaturase [Lishizhenia sp.]